jgi:hypothetical protein
VRLGFETSAFCLIEQAKNAQFGQQPLTRLYQIKSESIVSNESQSAKLRRVSAIKS